MSINPKHTAVGAVMLAVFGAPAAQASVIGDTMSLEYRLPDFNTVYGPFTATPNPFVAITGVPSAIGTLENVTTFTTTFSSTGSTDTLTYLINTTLTSPMLQTQPFNGPVLTVLSGAAFGSVLSVSGLVDASRILNTGTVLGVNLSGVSYMNGSTISITFDTSPVPLPAALPMFGAAVLALGLVGYGAKRRRAVAPQI